MDDASEGTLRKKGPSLSVSRYDVTLTGHWLKRLLAAVEVRRRSGSRRAGEQELELEQEQEQEREQATTSRYTTVCTCTPFWSR